MSGPVGDRRFQDIRDGARDLRYASAKRPGGPPQRVYQRPWRGGALGACGAP